MLKEYPFQLFTLAVLGVSFFFDKQKTRAALKTGFSRFASVFPPFVMVLLLTSAVLGFFTPQTIQTYLGSSKGCWSGSALAALLGSVSVMPGFVAFPLGAILVKNNIPYMVVSAFTTTLMMVGVITFPYEKSFIGTVPALVRNFTGLCIALAAALVTGLLYGEI